jgi:hypothetical protein
MIAAVAAAGGRFAIGMPKSIARHEWDAARARRAESRAGAPESQLPEPPTA